MLSKFEESTLSGIHRGVILLGCSSSPFGQPGEDQFPTAEISQTDRSTGGILSVAVQACLCEHVCVSLEALQYLSELVSYLHLPRLLPCSHTGLLTLPQVQ